MTPVLAYLRQATSHMHLRLEQRFDAVAELADPLRRSVTVGRYAALYSSAQKGLAAALANVEGLEYQGRGRDWPFVELLSSAKAPVFPEPAGSAEALGTLYVVEGSALGGRLILRELQARGIDEPDLAFLDPYGADGGRMWRALLAILEREGSRDPASLQSLCRGATRGFAYAEQILCGEIV